MSLEVMENNTYEVLPKQLNPKYTKNNVKHGDASVMVWGCFTVSGVGPLVKIAGIMDCEMYRSILKNNLSEEYADILSIAWIFQQDNDLKYCRKIVKLWFSPEEINVLL